MTKGHWPASRPSPPLMLDMVSGGVSILLCISPCQRESWECQHQDVTNNIGSLTTSRHMERIKFISCLDRRSFKYPTLKYVNINLFARYEKIECYWYKHCGQLMFSTWLIPWQIPRLKPLISLSVFFSALLILHLHKLNLDGCSIKSRWQII